MKEEIVIAFVGNPNVGKTALINAISGAELKVGNWPGVTVERKEALFEHKGVRFRLVDLPGVYSLSPYTLEERISQEFLLDGNPDVIVNVVDSTNLERNLYLTTQLADLGKPMVLVLNMWDEFQSKGYQLDIPSFERFLGIPCVPTAATRGVGVERVLDAVVDVIEGKTTPHKVRFSRIVEEELRNIERFLLEAGCPYPLRWSAVKLLERDSFFEEKLKKRMVHPLPDWIEESIERIEQHYNDDIETVLAEQRYGYINGLLKEVLKRPIERRLELTDLVDKVLLNRILGLPVFLFLVYLMFKITFDGSAPFIDWIDGFFNGFLAKWISFGLREIGAPSWLNSLVVDAILQGVGLVISFVPLMFFLYTFMALLEESGYMARAAFLMDRIMHAVGLHGKSFIPMVIGFGCNVPAILATRTLENERDRKLTALLVPFMSCGARLPIYALFAGVFFSRHRAEVVMAMYLMGVGISLIVGFVLKKTVFSGDAPPFIMELPPYRLPTLRMLWHSTWFRTKAFIKKAGTVIAAAMVILWLLLNLPYGAPPERSLLGRVASTLSVLFVPAGFGHDWRPVAALIPGTAAKEIVVGALGQLYAVEEGEDGEQPGNFWEDLKDQVAALCVAFVESFKNVFGTFKTASLSSEGEEAQVARAIRDSFTPLSALSYMVFCLLWIPCVSTLAVLYQEFGWKTVGLSIFITTSVPWLVSSIIYTVGRLLGYH